MSYKVEVIADNSGKWCGNGLRFNTKAEADVYGRDLSGRWTLVRKYRIVEAADESTIVPSTETKS